MPEPDFDQIAQRLLEDLPDAFLTRGASAWSAVPGIAEQLRQVWNARGAADIQKIEIQQQVIRQQNDLIANLHVDVRNQAARADAAWNARGAADIAAIVAELTARFGPTPSDAESHNSNALLSFVEYCRAALLDLDR